MLYLNLAALWTFLAVVCFTQQLPRDRPWVAWLWVALAVYNVLRFVLQVRRQRRRKRQASTPTPPRLLPPHDDDAQRPRVVDRE